ncbi:hypothetical protein E2R55_22755 [Vibrio vulnificus]|nr:hypothetical protein E2R55_22755 [Vibrio vulnificus]
MEFFVWDGHGSKYGVYLKIAAQSMVDYIKGKSYKEIPKWIRNSLSAFLQFFIKNSN